MKSPDIPGRFSSWVASLVAAGYEVFAVNPLSVARYRAAALDLGRQV